MRSSQVKWECPTPTSITFELYSAPEIRKMSVVQVITPLSMSATGQALQGGLYDPRMGPHNSRANCGTCQKNIEFCSGHFGHIELPLPVINPLFNKTVLQLFRITCMNCHLIIIPAPVKHLAMTQLKLLKEGLVREAQEAEFVFSDLAVDESQSRRRTVNADSDADYATRAEEYLRQYLKGGSSSTLDQSRLGEALKKEIFKKVSRHAKMNYKCGFCGTICKRITLSESKILYSILKKSDFDPLDSSSKDLSQEIGQGKQKYLTPLEAKLYLQAVWLKDKEFLECVFPVLTAATSEFPTDTFFIDVLPVPPPKNRPAQFVNGILVEHPINVTLRNVVQSCSLIRYVIGAVKNGLENLSSETQLAVKAIHGQTLEDKLELTWNHLQADVDRVMDRDRNKSNAQTGEMMGLRQLIERKEGLFRMHMMGKRVNYAARTVITPDPFISIDEIGIPDVFAKVLTYPCTVTPANIYLLRQLILNGPNQYPGATAVKDENGNLTRLSAVNKDAREAIANRLLVSDSLKDVSFAGVKTVYRHLQNGDMLIMNRQPSLHRPSIMAHRARVLCGEKVFRLHYANCKHYNADFDGDEMNAHFPQDDESKAEAATLVNACNHFLVPKDGTPLGGLIQDHVVAAVKLTIRGRFFCEEDYHQLVFFALSGRSQKILLEPPTILKPVYLWSGKQVITTVVKNLVPPTKSALTFASSAKIKANEWRQWGSRPCVAGGAILDDDMSESCVIFHRGMLLAGILDKVHLGATPFGLCHAFYELYGSLAAGSLLSAFSKLCTNFLQWEGFTLGIKDILVMPEADAVRTDYMLKASNVGPEAAAKAVGLPASASMEIIESKVEDFHLSRDAKAMAIIDGSYKQVLDKFTNKINGSCLPYGLVTIFPHNNLQLLVQSGAKGSAVNTMQISCLLGQIELEGKRPPLTIAGKSLPSFKSYDVTPRAGGFILGRFLTGIRPQEFFFHCMAGREGLIDTAVKTSRSGYLQRCLVKLLEGVVAQYDMTVRDSDGSVIQFLYGEDGLDVGKCQYLKQKQIKFIQQNYAKTIQDKAKTISLMEGDEITKIKDNVTKWKKTDQTIKRINGFLKFCKRITEFDSMVGFNEKTGRSFKSEALIDGWKKLTDYERSKHMKKLKKCPEPVLGTFLPTRWGVVSENLEQLAELQGDSTFADVVYSKAMEALANPGDAVGVLAAQSIGEPSTQMTLNTFHFAGRGEMNVTLGIPRLREILMVASERIKTPCMDIPFRDHITEDMAELLRRKLTRVTLDQVLQQVTVTEKLDAGGVRYYQLKFQFLSFSEYSDTFVVTPSFILRFFENLFIRARLIPAIRKALKLRQLKNAVEVDSENKFQENGEEIDDDFVNASGSMFTEAEKRGLGEEHESSDEEEHLDDDDVTQIRHASRKVEAEYENPEEEERVQDDEDKEELSGEELNALGEGNEGDESLLKVVSTRSSKVNKSTVEIRRSSVIAIDGMICNYEFDREKQEWCELTLKVTSPYKINMGLFLKDVASKSVIHQVPEINRAFVLKNNGKLCLRTEGINILAMATYHNELDLNKLHCNNIHTMARHYGVEAALKVLIKELSDVFKAYGIVIDPRHLSLVADYMTTSGVYKPFNRIGIGSSSSPLHQMSFETVVAFLRDATLEGKRDNLQNPSSRLIVGRPVNVGTELFECHASLPGRTTASGARSNLKATKLSKHDSTNQNEKIICA